MTKLRMDAKSARTNGKEYLDVVKEGLNHRWVDVYENKENAQVLILQAHI